MKRKLLALALTAIMLLTAFPMAISAEENIDWDQYLPDPDSIVTSGSLTDTVSWAYSKSDKTIYIAGTGAMPDFTGVKNHPWHDTYVGTIERFVVSEGITHVGRFAFAGCQQLTEIVWPSTLETAGDRLFHDCRNLKSVTLPAVETIHAEMLKDSWLQHIVVPEGVKKIDEIAFRAMYSLETVVLPESLEEIGAGAFMACTKLKSINIPEGVKKINDLTFECCWALEDITIPETTDLNSWGAFTECDKLCDENGYLIINDVLLNYTADVTSEVFVVPDGVKFVGALFAKRDRWGNDDDPVVHAKKIILPDSVEGVAELAFYKNDELEEVVLSKNMKHISDEMFYYCENLKKITLPEKLETLGANAFSNCKKLEEVVIPAGVTELCTGVFDSCESLKNVTITRGVETISTSAFANCTSLETVSYKGTEDDWANVVVLEDNEPLLAANFTFEEILEIIGDVNRDGVLSAADALCLRKYLAKMTPESSIDLSGADINGDGKVNALDQLLLRRALCE